MAHTLTLGSINLANASASSASPGIVLKSFTPVPIQRVMTRVTGMPFRDGGTPTSEALDDVEASITCRIYGSSPDNVESQLQSLIRELEEAVTWSVYRNGTATILTFKRQGVTNTTRFLVKGYTGPTIAGEEKWLDIETLGNFLTIQFTLTLSPYGLSDAAVEILADSFTNQPTDNIGTATAATGHVGGPINVRVTATSVAGSWTQMWVAQVGTTPILFNLSGSADAAAYGTAVATATANGTETNTPLGSVSLSDRFRWPNRIFARIKKTSGTDNVLLLRWAIAVAGTTGVNFMYGPYVKCASGSAFQLIDLQALQSLLEIEQRREFTTGTIQAYLYYKTVDATTVNFSIDYAEFLPYIGITKLTGTTLAANQEFVYEDFGSSLIPHRTTQVYKLLSSDTMENNLSRQGRLMKVPGGAAHRFWVAGQTATTHTLADTMDIRVNHLPAYSLGMRGAG